MNRIEIEKMEMFASLSEEDRARLVELFDKKENGNLSKEEAIEYGRLVGRAIMKSTIKWSV